MGTSSSSLRILLLEDHTDTADALARVLRLMGHAVDCAGTVSAGRSLIQSVWYDLLLCDIGLPDGDGRELFREARDLPGGAGVRGIVLSGFGMEPDVRQSLDEGFHAHLIKPCALPQLTEAMDRAMSVPLPPPPPSVAFHFPIH